MAACADIIPPISFQLILLGFFKALNSVFCTSNFGENIKMQEEIQLFSPKSNPAHRPSCQLPAILEEAAKLHYSAEVAGSIINRMLKTSLAQK